MNRTIAAVAVGLLLVTSGCGASNFNASGTVGLIAVDAAEDDCSAGIGGFDDIREGASVVISDAEGKRVALGSLQAGSGDGACLFAFDVADIPSGQGPYAVEVASRGEVAFNEEDADGIVLSLG